MKTNESEVQNLIKNFHAKPSLSDKSDQLDSKKSAFEVPPGKKSVSNKNNNENIFISNSNHTRNKSNIFAPTPNPMDDEEDQVNNDLNVGSSKRLRRAEKSRESEKSKSNEKNLRPPKDKKIISSAISSNNNNELLYSKELKRDSNHNKNRKGLGEKGKL